MSAADVMETTQYLTFKLDQDVFGMDIAKVREVLDFTAVTRVPKMPEFMRGVINLRGSAVPVVDLRLKLGMKRTEKTDNTCIIITEVTADGEPTVLGILADSVQEVVDIDPAQVEPAPKLGARLNTQFLRGMGKKDSAFIILLEIDPVFSMDELVSVKVAEREAIDVLPAADIQ